MIIILLISLLFLFCFVFPFLKLKIKNVPFTPKVVLATFAFCAANALAPIAGIVLFFICLYCNFLPSRGILPLFIMMLEIPLIVLIYFCAQKIYIKFLPEHSLKQKTVIFISPLALNLILGFLVLPFILTIMVGW